MTEPRERDRVTFQDMKKLAATPEPSSGSAEEKKENSGIIHLSELASGEAAPQAQQDPTQGSPSSPAASPARLPVKVNAPPPAGRDPTAPILSVQPPEPPAPTAASRASIDAPRDAMERIEKKRNGTPVWVALAAGMALGALVACAFFMMRGVAAARGEHTAAWAAVSLDGPRAATVRATAERVVASASAPGAGVATPSPDTLPEVALASLPSAPAAPSPVAALPSASAPAGVARATGTAEGASPGVSTVPGSDQSLEALMKKAVGATANPISATSIQPPVAEAPAPTPGNLPPKPAMGAVQGALGTVLPSARFCLGPDDPVSRATITFKSDGSVQGVSVTGDASGQPAEGCIRSRLMSARVPPFTAPTFTWTVTVRPAS
jgi:hypothetical protein